jgi:hypothetical protein
VHATSTNSHLALISRTPTRSASPSSPPPPPLPPSIPIATAVLSTKTAGIIPSCLLQYWANEREAPIQVRPTWPKSPVLANTFYAALKAPLPRSKRQARADIFNDEDENPFYSKGSSPKVAQGGEPMQLDSFSDSKPTKRGHTGKNFTPSPVELRGHLDIITHSNGL